MAVIGLESDTGESTSLARGTREFKTIAVMLRMHCRAHHAVIDGSLCHACTKLHDHAQRRLERCAFGEATPSCAKCTVHCYKAAMREQIRQVMAWAGSRMLWRHPVLMLLRPPG